MTEFREYFIGGPLNGKDKREEYPDVADTVAIRYTDGEVTYSYGRMIVMVFDYHVPVWIDARYGSPELDRLRIAEMFMAPHMTTPPVPVTMPDINVQPMTLDTVHRFRVRMDGAKSSVLAAMEMEQGIIDEGPDDDGWLIRRGTEAYLVMVADAEDVPDHLDLMADSFPWEVITGPFCGNYEGRCVRVSDGTAEFHGHRVIGPEETGERPPTPSETDTPEDQPEHSDDD